MAESAGGFTGQRPGVGGAFGLAQQHYDVNSGGHGFIGGTLTRGNRVAPDPNSFFSTPIHPMMSNMNNQQFGGNAPVLGGSRAEPEPEEDD